jgi:hypothetical protein
MPTPSEFRHIEAARLRETTAWLEKRILATFPGRALGNLAFDLGDLVGDVEADCGRLAKPNWPLRILAASAILLLFLLLCASFSALPLKPADATWIDLLQGIEAALNELVMAGLVILFLASLENRRKRGQALAGLRDLRGMAHVIELHQMTKDPEIALARAEESEVVQLGPRELALYLSFCADLLSIVGKTAALYGQVLDDSVVLATVDEVEGVSARAAGKIWQKLALISVAGR